MTTDSEKAGGTGAPHDEAGVSCAMRQVVSSRFGGARPILAAVVVPALIIAAGYFIDGGSQAATSAPPLLESTYVGATACAGCHATEADAWTKSHHALAMQHASEATVLGDFDDAAFVDRDLTTTFFRRDGKFMVRTDGADGTLRDFAVRFTFGVAPLQQYLLELPGGRLQALSIAWDSRPKESGGQRWFHLYPNETIRAGDPLHWTGLQQNWNYMCAECHSTNLIRGYDAATSTYATTYSEINVACESCHGPGSRHVAWARQEPGWEAIDRHGLAVLLDERRDVAWKLDPATGNSSRSEPRTTTREIETCALCHSRRGPISSKIEAGAPIGDSHRVVNLDDGLYFPDGQIRDEVYEYGSFLQSRMFHAGVTCSDCHEPHSLELRAEGSGVCLQCHGADRFATTAHHHHPPASQGAECISCHMPERTYMVVDGRRDHSFRIPRPDLSVSLGTPNACGQCHTDKTAAWAAAQVKSWFPTPHPGFQNFAELLSDGNAAAAGVRERLVAFAADRAQPAIARASALDRLDRVPNPVALAELGKLLADADPLVRRSAVSAYGTLPPDARGSLLPLLDDPILDVRLAAARLLADLPADRLDPSSREKRERGLAEYVASQMSNADRPEAHHNIGVLSISLGRYADAEAELKEALRLDPGFVPAAVTLADLYRGLGRDPEAEPLLRAMISRQPTAAAAHYSLALWLIRARRHDAALAELKQAAELEPSEPRFSYVYAVALAELGNPAQAMQVLRTVLQLHPNHRDSLLALAGYERDAGNTDAAIRYATRLVELEPDDASVRQFLAELRQ